MTAGPAPPRLAAFRVLRDVRQGAFADRAAERRLSDLSPRDRRLAQELAYGCVRLRARLDHELAAFLDRPPARVEPDVLEWLRLGVYQLRELRTPAHAALDESVEGVRRTVGERATGFVNGVLRAVSRHEDRAALFPSAEDDPARYLTKFGSHPAWLVERWLDRWPRDRVFRLVELDNRPPPVTVRWLEGDPGEAASRLGEAGVRLKPLEGWPRCARLEAGDPGPALAGIPAVVQDPAASAVVDYVGAPEDGPFLDACAGPGGKAVALAYEAGRSIPFVAADVQPRRLRLTVKAARRTGADLHAVAADARRPAVRHAATVLVDAPCTGTGTLRRRPDLRWRVEPDRLEAMTGLQREILDACADVVTPGGTLVYATCSLEPEENEDQVTSFLQRHDAFERAVRPAPPALPADVVTADGTLRVLPWTRETDGAFAVRLRKRST